MTEVVVVSMFGRGHWMAWELAERGMKVQLVDLSESMGRWTPEDWEGPFGFSKGDGLTASQLARLQEEDDLEPVHEGWTFWVPEGPLDTRGPLSQHFLSGPLKATSGQGEFDQTWPYLLSQSLSSTVFHDHWRTFESKSRLDVFSPFFVHRVSRRGFQNSLEWCRKRGVEVFESASLMDIQLEAGQVSGVEISSEFKGVLQAEQYIWCLSSLETQKLQSKVTPLLFPNGVLEIEWSWIRFRFAFDVGHYQKVVPQHSVVIEDLHLPWTHANLLILQKTVKPQHYDVWMKLPTHHRFQRAYLEDMGQKALQVLQKKLPVSQIQILEMPQDYLYEFDELGPSLFPVFNAEKREKLALRNFKNMAYDGPEQWPSLDWMGRFQHQVGIVEKIKTWKTKKTEAELKKKGERDRTIYTP